MTRVEFQVTNFYRRDWIEKVPYIVAYLLLAGVLDNNTDSAVIKLLVAEEAPRELLL